MLILTIWLWLLLLLGRRSIKGDYPVLGRLLLLSPLLLILIILVALILIGVIAVHAKGIVAVLCILGLQEHVGMSWSIWSRLLTKTCSVTLGWCMPQILHRICSEGACYILRIRRCRCVSWIGNRVHLAISVWHILKATRWTCSLLLSLFTFAGL